MTAVIFTAGIIAGITVKTFADVLVKKLEVMVTFHATGGAV